MFYKKLSMGALLFAFSTISYSAGWTNDYINEVAVKYGHGCVKLNNGEVVEIDINTAVGKAEFSIVLSAEATNKKLQVYQTDDPLIGGCDTGTTVKQHSKLRIIN